MSKVDTFQLDKSMQLTDDVLSPSKPVKHKNVREAVANNRIDGLPINPRLLERVFSACESNQKLVAEQFIKEFVTQN
ncbi:hypothetical protein [uncultured Paraglaciecola sp.]|uniref:hypothetical protein n=1 Tax=uncultured Paraglaciecola sp. TaxID=1765024 RepID=UPI002594230E|nr:hypothetical protein [uncultured Paraglaciecola sp.]